MSSIDIEAEIRAIVRAFVGGIRYGVKIRLPHALVMTVLFQKNRSPSEMINTIFKLTRNHALNLAAFATIYKTILALLKAASISLHSPNLGANSGIMRWVGRQLIELLVEGSSTGQRLVERPPGLPVRNLHALIAGSIGGFIVWGSYTKVNVQINLYLLSRILMGVGKRYGFTVEDDKYPWFAALVWGAVMFLYEDNGKVLHPSLAASMDEIYRYESPVLSSKKEGPGKPQLERA